MSHTKHEARLALAVFIKRYVSYAKTKATLRFWEVFGETGDNIPRKPNLFFFKLLLLEQLELC